MDLKILEKRFNQLFKLPLVKVENSTRVIYYSYNKDNLELYIIYKATPTRIYKYIGVKPSKVESFTKSQSKGGWVQQNLIKNQTKYYAYVIPD